MTDLEDRLRQLSTAATDPAPPVQNVMRRAGQLRRRRRVREAAAAAAVVAVVGVVGITLSQLPRAETGVVFEQPPAPLPDGWTRTQVGALTIDHPKAWQTRRIINAEAPDPEVVLSSHPLSNRDLERAMLARDDVRFSAGFPSEAVVFVVGGDDLVAPPPPDNALGDPEVLPRPRGFDDDVLVRTGRIRQSILHLAAYIGPDAPRAAVDTVGMVAQRLRLRQQPRQPGEQPPPPAEGPLGGNGIDPDNAIFTQPWPVQAQLRLDDDEVINVRANGDCVALTMENTVETRNKSVQRERCGVVAPGSALEPFASGAIMGGTVRGDLEDAERHLIVARVRSDVHTVTYEEISGGTARTVTENGWFIALTDGRIARLVALDADGRRIGTLNDP